MIPVTDKTGKVHHVDGIVGTSDERHYLTVMIEGRKHFFALDAAVEMTSTFTHSAPGTDERRCIAKQGVSQSYDAFLATREKRREEEDDDDLDPKRTGTGSWADDY